MITLSTERGFVDVERWQDVIELPGFSGNLDPSQKKLKEIIGRYIFPERIPCGLSTCHQPHSRGFIVVTESGEVTNIGKDCGSTHFEVDFDNWCRRFTQRVTDQQNRQLITSFLFRLEKIESEIDLLRTRPKGANWVYHTCRALISINKGCPDSIVQTIGHMVRMRNGVIILNRLATEDEVEKAELIAGRKIRRPHYVQDVIGSLRGLESLYQENDIRDVLILDMTEGLKKLSLFDVDQATSTELTAWSKWCQEFESKLARMQEAVKAGGALLTRANLSQLTLLLHERRDRMEFEKWMSQTL